MKIAWKFILTLEMFIISMFIFIIIFSYLHADITIRTDAVETLDSIISLKSNMLQDYFDEKHNDLNHLKIIFSKNQSNTASENMDNILLDRIKADDSYKEIFILNEAGRVIHSTNKSNVGKSKLNEPYFIMGLGNFFIQSFYYDISYQEPTTALSIPFKSINSSTYVIVGFLQPNKITEIMIESTGSQFKGETYLVNNFNFVVSTLKNDDNQGLNKPIFTQIVKNCLSKKNNEIEFLQTYSNYEDKTVIGAAKYLEKLNVCIIAEITEYDVFLPIYTFYSQMIFFGLLFFILMHITGVIIAKTITRPLEKLTKYASNFHRHGFDKSLEIKSDDEVKILADTFIQSKKEIENAFDMLNNQNEELQTINEELQASYEEINSTNAELEASRYQLSILNRDLEMRVQQRTQEIEKLLKQKDEFINQLGHDLKTPLSPLINLLPVIEQKIQDPSLKEMTQISMKASNRIKKLVQKTLKLAELNTTKFQLKYQDTILYYEIEEAINRNKFLLKDKDIKIINNNNEKFSIHVDSILLGELFDNLISNAIKYSPSGSMIIIDTSRYQDYLLVSIKDQGFGLTQTQMNYIFDEFYKTDESRHDLESSGLGMSISKRIIEKHGGQIWAESDGPGKGSTFFFTLPSKNHIESENKVNQHDTVISMREKIDDLLLEK